MTDFDGFVDSGVSDFVLGTSPDDDRLAVIDHSRGSRRDWTYAELIRSVAGLAGHLRGLGLHAEDVVAVLMENSAEFVIAYHGTLTAGCVVLPLDPRDPAGWAPAIAATDAKAVIVETALGLPESVIPAQRVVCLGTAVTPGSTQWTEALLAPAVPRPIRDGNRPAVLMSSSGTSRAPKRVAVTHRNLVTNLGQIEALHRIHAGERVLSVSPLRHIYGMQMAMNPALRVGATLVIEPTPFDVANCLRHLSQHEVAVAYLVPSVLAELAAQPLGAAPPHGLRLVVSGGAPLPSAVAVRAEELLAVPVVQGFGMTEAGCVSFSPDGRSVPTGSVGVFVPHTDVRLVDPATGADAVPGQPGELWVRGPQVVSTCADPDGWLRTGDLVTRDPAGFVRIAGRLKSMIKYKGNQVSPAELEDVLTAHPAVVEAFVVGVPDPVAGEAPKAYVVLEGETPLAEVSRHVAERVAPYKRIRAIERVRAIPRSSTGKAVRPPALRVLVTGGSRGLGRAFAEELAAAGASVLVTGRDEAALAETAKRIQELDGIAEYAVADLLDERAMADTVECMRDRFGGVDVLVNNAGVPGPHGPLWETREAEWWQTVETNVRGTAMATRAVVPTLLDQGSGRVVTVVSRAGRQHWPYAGAYSMSKAALISMTANLAVELRGTGVVTVAFDPGLMDIGITTAHLRRGHTGDEWADRILDWTLKVREKGRFTSLETSTRALVAVVTGAADHLSGDYVTTSEVEAGGHVPG